MKERILRRAEVQARTGVSRSGIYAAIKSKTFPAPVKLGVRAVGWLESEIDGWIDERIRHSRAGSIAAQSISDREAASR